MMFFSASHRSLCTNALALSGAAIIFIPAATCARAQGYGPPPPFKPMASVRFGGAYDGPRYAPQRTIIGFVKDDEDHVVSSAMVYLKDVQAKSTLVVFANPDGAFRFGPLSLSHDYEVWAAAGELKSTVKSVSTLMTQNEVSIPIRMRAEHNHGTPPLKRRPAAVPEAASRPVTGAQPK